MPFILDPGKKIPKKISKKLKKLKKPLSDIIFFQNGMRQAEKEKKKILLPNSVRTRLGLENSEKNDKKFYSRMPFILDPAKKIPKEIVKKLKKFKNHFPTLFLAKTG